MTSPTSKEVLLRAAEIIEQGWCRGSYATTESGEKVSVRNKDATSWCAIGALYKAESELGWDVMMPGRKYGDRACHRLSDHLFGNGHIEWMISEWNDNPTRTAAEVADAMRKAAEAA